MRPNTRAVFAESLGNPSLAVLEDGVVLRDFASVHRATGEGAETRVGAGTLVMTLSGLSSGCFT